MVSGRTYRRRSYGVLLYRQAYLAAGDQTAHNRVGRTFYAGLRPLAGYRSAKKLFRRPPSFQLARVVGLWHRGIGRYGLPYHGSAICCAWTRLSAFRRMQCSIEVRRKLARRIFTREWSDIISYHLNI